eukprot:4581359-Karenia_brevis.AAC.1
MPPSYHADMSHDDTSWQCKFCGIIAAGIENETDTSSDDETDEMDACMNSTCHTSSSQSLGQDILDHYLMAKRMWRRFSRRFPRRKRFREGFARRKFRTYQRDSVRRNGWFVDEHGMPLCDGCHCGAWTSY